MKHPARPSPGPTPDDRGMLTRRDLARQLHISVRTLHEWQQGNVIPRFKVGKVVLFYWPDVVSALREKHSLPPPAQPPKEAGLS